jgi:purine-binding chemotaxis protein CheW
MMSDFFIFTIADEFFALPLGCIDTVVRAVQLVRLPEASPGLLGVLDVRGTIVPVIDVNTRLKLPLTAISVDQRLVIAHNAERKVAFIVDAVEVIEPVPPESIISSSSIYPSMDNYVSAIIRRGEQKVLLCDPEQFLSVANGVFPEVFSS